MKMEKVSDYISAENVNNNDALHPLPTDVGREFVRQYYTKWLFQLGDVFQFYGNHSYFLHDGHEALGRTNIQKTIDNLNYENCKARIHSVTGLYGDGNSLVLQVCGELSINDSAPRKFVQNFVLREHMSKTYYVQTDIFQWLDKAFCADAGEGVESAVKETKKESAKKEKENEQIATPHQNGHSLNQGQQPALADSKSHVSQPTGDDNVASKEYLPNSVAEPPSLQANNNYTSPTKPVDVTAQHPKPAVAPPPHSSAPPSHPPATATHPAVPSSQPSVPPTQPSAPPSTNSQQAPLSQSQNASPASHWKSFREKRPSNNAGGHFNNNGGSHFSSNNNGGGGGGGGGGGAPTNNYRYHNNRESGGPPPFRGNRGGPPGNRFSSGGPAGNQRSYQQPQHGGGAPTGNNKYGGPPSGGRGAGGGGGGPRFQQHNSQQQQSPQNSSTFK